MEELTKYPNLNRLILEEDREFHLFLSGGRVRVLVDKVDHEDNFYGEGADAYECLDQAEKNCELKLTYEEGYQNEGHPFKGYLTGAYPTEWVDASLFNHGYIYIRRLNNKVCLITDPSESYPVPVISGDSLEDALDKFNKAIENVYDIPEYNSLKRSSYGITQ